MSSADAITTREETNEQDAVRNPSPVQESQVEIPEDKVDEISSYLQNEIYRAEADKSELDQKLLDWQRAYEAEPEEEEKDFPWPGASNLVVPVSATAVESVFSRLMNSIFGAKEVFHAVPRSPNWADLADPITKWLNWLSDEVLNMYEVFQSWLLTTIKFGTGIMKTSWDRRLRNVVYRDRHGTLQNEPTVLYDAPRLHNVPLSNFLASSDTITTGDVQYGSWVGDKQTYTWKELKELESSGKFKNVDRIKYETRQYVSEHEQQTQEYTGWQTTQAGDYEVYEIWLSYQVNEGEPLSELVVNIEKETGVILRAVYNFFRHQERPYHLIRYMPREDSIFGIGMVKMLEDVQSEITTIHRQRLDNATLANTKAFKKRKGTVVQSQEIFPGAFIDVDEPDDIMELELGTEHSTLLVEEQHTNAIGEKRTGVSDYSMGRESSAIGSRATATSTMALIREGNKRFQMTIRDIRRAMGNMAHQIIMLYQQFAPNAQVMYEQFSEEDQRIIQEYFQLPPDQTRTSVRIDTPALSETNNKEMMQQTMMTLIGVLQQFYQGMFQVTGVATNPQAPPAMRSLGETAAKTGSKIFERLLESFDFPDSENYTPDIDQLLQMSQLAEQLGMGGMNGQASQQQGTASDGQGQGGFAGTPVQGQQQTMGNGQGQSTAGVGLSQSDMASLGG